MRTDYTNTEPEMLEEINKIFHKDIDPIFMELARRIEPRIENPRYMPWLLAHKMSPECARILMALPDPDWTPELGDHMVSDKFIGHGQRICPQSAGGPIFQRRYFLR